MVVAAIEELLTEATKQENAFCSPTPAPIQTLNRPNLENLPFT
jgi:hypothetical protein